MLPDAIIATNTSALSVTEIATAVPQPERVVGMHFFNPVHKMKLVELVRGIATSDETVPYSPEDLTGHEIQRIDPVLGDMPGASLPPDPAAIAAAAAAVSVNPLLHQPERKPSLDALIDVITPLVLDHEVSGDALLAALPGTRRVGSKPFAVEGLCDATGEWETPRLGQRYRALQAGVQLANRAGALNDIEFSEFVVKAQAFADAVGAAPEFPDMRAEV
eukprot:gene33966-56660_t